MFFGFGRDWPIVHGIPLCGRHKLVISAKAKALPHEGALAVVVNRYLSCT